MITDFRNKKLSDYLRDLPPGSRVLIRFGHGWGDTQMFMTSFYELKTLFPEHIIDLYIESGQEEIFTSYPTKDSTSHDIIFSLDFPMCEGGTGTKAHKCCVEELGITPSVNEFPTLPDEESPLVACHFQGTALPNSVNCPTDTVKQIWEEVIAFGKIPIECHFEHMFHNPRNSSYGFMHCTVRGCKASLHSLIGLIQHSYAFIGVASGPFITALCEIPSRTLYLESHHRLESYTKQKIPKVDVNNYKPGQVHEWLKTLKNLDTQDGEVVASENPIGLHSRR